MGIPTAGEEFEKLIANLRYAQENCAMLSHLAKANGSNIIGQGWLTVSEGLKRMQLTVTLLAQGKLQ